MRRGFIDIFLEFIFKINYMIFNFHLNNTHGHNVASHETLVVPEIIEIWQIWKLKVPIEILHFRYSYAAGGLVSRCFVGKKLKSEMILNMKNEIYFNYLS